MDEKLLRDLFASLPGITIRHFFGGQGIYSEGAIVAVVIDGELHLKSDADTGSVFEEAGCQRWRYQRVGRAPVAMPYHRVPDTAFDDPDEMAQWAELAAQAARNSARKASRKRSAQSRIGSLPS